MFNTLPDIISKLIGKRPAFELEQRIFHTICVITLFALFLNLFVDYFIGMPDLSWLMAIGFVMVAVAYYASRVKNHFKLSIVIYNLLSNGLLIINYLNNSGTQGPSLFIFMLASFINISVVPKKQCWYWIAFNMLIVLSLLGIEYFDQDSIPYTYIDRSGRFFDLAYSYLVIVFIMAVITTYVRRSYNVERLQVEQKAHELEQSNITKNKLFSILAHDLRAPLASIQNYLEILSQFGLDESERISIKKDLLNATQNTQKLLSNLLLWTKSQMEGVSVNLAAVYLNDVLSNTLVIQKGEAERKGITLINDMHNDALVIADPDMLQLIVRNLINNAIKFNHSGGEIRVVSDYSSGNECCITIADNGIGIPFEQQSQIFSLNASSTYGTKNEKGVGLGLLLCKEFTELQGGRIWFESIPSKGTSFYLGLKIYKGDAAAQINSRTLTDNKTVS